MQEERGLFELSTEIRCVAMVITGLGNQLNHNKSDTLSHDAMKEALYGMRVHLERIAEDLESIECRKAV